MSKLSDLVAKATIREFAQGAAQSTVQPVADFLAPTVNVAANTGYYKKYTEKSRFRLPDARRSLNGPAAQLGWDAKDEKYNATPYALDVPVDVLEQDADEDALKEAAGFAAEVGGLIHEKTVIDAALAAAGAGTNQSVAAEGVNLISIIDKLALDVLKATGYGSIMGVGLLFGPAAFERFKNHASVTGKFVVGNSGKTSQAINPGIGDVSGLLLSKPEVRMSLMVYDKAPEGKAADIDFLLNDSVLIFTRQANPTRRDPSFMKTFRRRDRWMQAGVYSREDGRGEVAKMDWSCDVVTANALAVKRLNLTA